MEEDHETWVIRGLVCGPCNWLIAKLGDDPEAFERIADYFRHPPAVRALGVRRAPGRLVERFHPVEGPLAPGPLASSLLASGDDVPVSSAP